MTRQQYLIDKFGFHKYYDKLYKCYFYQRPDGMNHLSLNDAWKWQIKKEGKPVSWRPISLAEIAYKLERRGWVRAFRQTDLENSVWEWEFSIGLYDIANAYIEMLRREEGE